MPRVGTAAPAQNARSELFAYAGHDLAKFIRIFGIKGACTVELFRLSSGGVALQSNQPLLSSGTRHFGYLQRLLKMDRVNAICNVGRGRRRYGLIDLGNCVGYRSAVKQCAARAKHKTQQVWAAGRGHRSRQTKRLSKRRQCLRHEKVCACLGQRMSLLGMKSRGVICIKRLFRLVAIAPATQKAAHEHPSAKVSVLTPQFGQQPNCIF